MAGKDDLRWFRAEVRVVDLEKRFPNHALVVRRRRGIGRIPHEHLTPEEGMLLARIDARTTIGELPGITGFSLAAVLRVLYVLMESGVLETVDASTLVREAKEGVELEKLMDTLEARMVEHAGNPFGILGVPPTASKAEIRKTFHALLMHFHPPKMRQYRRLEKRMDAIMEALLWALDEAGAATGAAAPAPPPAAKAAATVSLPYPHPKNNRERAWNLCAEAEQHLLAKDRPKAFVKLEQAAQLDPDNHDIALIMGNAMLGVRDLWHKAEGKFSAVLAKDPRNPDAWAGLARLYLKMNMHARALEAAERLRACAPLHPALPKIQEQLKK